MQSVVRREVCARLMCLLEEDRESRGEANNTDVSLNVRVSDLKVSIGGKYERTSS